MTHPRGFSVTEPSVAAVVGSLDSNTAQYAARVRLQGHRVEIIQARLSRRPQPGMIFAPSESCAQISTCSHVQSPLMAHPEPCSDAAEAIEAGRRTESALC